MTWCQNGEVYSVCNFENVGAYDGTFLGLWFVGNYAIYLPVSSSVMCSDQFYYYSCVFKIHIYYTILPYIHDTYK
jgi:hypothetical protein